MSLRNKLIRLAYQNPSLRDDILPLVKTSGAFEDAVKGKKFKNPETGNQVGFGSLPSKEQAKVRKDFNKGKEKSEKKEKGGDKKEWKSKLDTLTGTVSKQEKKLKDAEKKLEGLEKKCGRMKKEREEWGEVEEHWRKEIENHSETKKMLKEQGKDKWSDLSKEDKQKVYGIKEGGSTLGKLMGSASEKAGEIQSEMWQLDREVYDLRDDAVSYTHLTLPTNREV